MKVELTVHVEIPDVKVEFIEFDELGNADVTLRAGAAQAKCRIDADGSDDGSIKAALLSLAGIQIKNK